MQFWPQMKGQLDSTFTVLRCQNKFSSIHTVGVVLCPASLLHAEKESGEMGCLDSVERGTVEWNSGTVE